MPEGTAITTRGRARISPVVHLGDEVPQHRFGDFEVRDDAIFQGPDRDNIGRRAPEHAFCLIADCKHFVCPRLDRHYRRFAQDDALVFDIDEGVSRAEIDADVAG